MPTAAAEVSVKKRASREEKEWPKEEAFLAQEFDPQKKYMFELAEKNLPREKPVIDMHTMRAAPPKPYIPYRNIVLASMIIWKGQREMIRYYDGCDTIFAKDQPKDKDVIAQFQAQTLKRQFIDGKFGCYGDERMLLLFLLACSFNGKSDFRTRSADVVYIPTDAAAKAVAEEERLNQIEQALELAKNATEAKMMIHADYLGIPLEDFDSGNPLSKKEIRTAYRLEASRDAKRFIESYGNKALETKYYIKKALVAGLIDTHTNANKALWKSSSREICDISGLKNFDAILERLLEFSLLEDGEEFKIQVMALYNE